MLHDEVDFCNEFITILISFAFYYTSGFIFPLNNILILNFTFKTTTTTKI
jgi:hypothetical protein